MISAFDVINLFYICAVILFFWSTKTFGYKFSIFEFITAFSFALFFETFNINFNNHYSYPNSYFYIGKVSLEVLIGWYVIFLFGKFWIIVLISLFDNNKNGLLKISNYPLYILTNAYISAVVIMLIDPIASRTEWWKWFEPTPFLGVPVGEVYGIFISVVIISTLIWFLFNFLTKYFERQIYISKKLNKDDLLVFIFYEIYVIVGTVLTIIQATDNNDVLMGVLVVFLATQVMPFVVIMIYMSKNDFDNMAKQRYLNNKSIFDFLLVIMISTSIILSIIIIISILPQKIIILPQITSLHMVLTQFDMVVIGISLFFYLKIRDYRKIT